MSPAWSNATKRWVVTAGAVLLLGLLYFVRNQIPLVVLAVILAFLLNPVVDFLTYQGRLPRRLSAALVYLALVSLIIFPFFFVPNLIGRLAALAPDAATIRALLLDLINRLSSIETLQIGPNLAAALQAPLDRFGEVLRSASGAGLSFLGRLTASLASRLIDLVFTLVASLYLVMDTPRIFAYLGSLVPPGYERDAANLGREINAVWAGFFRGQLVLCLAIGIVTGTAMWLLGVPYAVWLGILAGILEIVPNIGPVLAAIPAIVLALFQGSTRFDINYVWFALLVALTHFLIQQVENHYFVPRIIGGSVNLHPVVTIVGVLVGASLVGILGIFLAAPTIATLRVLARYVHNKVMDRDPFPYAAPPPVPASEPPPLPAAPRPASASHAVPPASDSGL
ncbi:MAG: AI-2E family transporter [Anaerolineae bacterium]|nr:AI-2E family transporter [Anaerolineae bacterium]